MQNRFGISELTLAAIAAVLATAACGAAAATADAESSADVAAGSETAAQDAADSAAVAETQGSPNDAQSVSDGAIGSDAALIADAMPLQDSGIPTNCGPAEYLLDVAKGPGAGAAYAKATLSGSCTDSKFTVKSNGMPYYTYEAKTPNPLKTVNQSWTIERYPKIAAQTTPVPLLGVAGFTVAGLPFEGPNEAAQPPDQMYGDPVYNGLMDGCMGHTSPQEYHHHALSVKCLQKSSVSSATPWTLADPPKDQASPIIGWALDGFPVYGPIACMDKNCTQVAEMKSGYVKVGDPKTYAWKAYAYTAVPADPTVLDACNGRVGPDGSYRYHATSTFPYIIGCYKGTPTLGGGGGDPGFDGGGFGPDAGGGGFPGGDGEQGGGPPSCKVDGDWVGKCEPSAKGCGCGTIMNGATGCIPTCKADGDCGKIPNGMQTYCKQGFCKP